VVREHGAPSGTLSWGAASSLRVSPQRPMASYVKTMLERAKRMMWKGVPPIVKLSRKVYKQPPQNTRRNTLPVKLIDGALVMRHEYLASAVVELMQIRKTASGTNRVLQHAPEAFDGIEVMATMGR
jgi:hypothetical protein